MLFTVLLRGAPAAQPVSLPPVTLATLPMPVVAFEVSSAAGARPAGPEKTVVLPMTTASACSTRSMGRRRLHAVRPMQGMQ